MSTKTKSKPDLLAKLAKVAPSISFRIIWEHDCDMIDIRKHCDGFDNEDPDDWQAWQSEVQAVAIIDGEEISGSDYLGGTWERACDHPNQSNPDISGYLPDMIGEALRDLVKQLPAIDTEQTIELREEIQSAISPTPNAHQWPRHEVKTVECRKRDLVVRIADNTKDREEPAYDVEVYIGGVYDWNESKTFCTRNANQTKQQAKVSAIAFSSAQIAKLL